MKLSHSLAILSRRKWIKLFLLGAVGRAAATRQTLLAGIVPSSDSALIPIRISQFPDPYNPGRFILDAPGGSLALYFSNYRYPLVVNRGEGNEFYAVDPTCTHQGCQVSNYSNFTSAMNCDCHGSSYNIQGQVIDGPAVSDLTSYPTYFDGSDLVQIELAGVPLRIDSVTIQAQTVERTRLKLQFPGTSGCKYQVQYYPDLTANPLPVLFAVSSEGIADQSFLAVPYASDGLKTVWVDAPGTQGFFTIEMVLGTFVPL